MKGKSAGLTVKGCRACEHILSEGSVGRGVARGEMSLDDATCVLGLHRLRMRERAT